MKYTTKLNWDREGIAEVKDDICCVCGEISKVLSVDTSDEEYGAMCICLDCIGELFDARFILLDKTDAGLALGADNTIKLHLRTGDLKDEDEVPFNIQFIAALGLLINNDSEFMNLVMQKYEKIIDKLLKDKRN